MIVYVLFAALLAQATIFLSPPEVTPIAHVETRGDGPIDMVLIPSLWCDWTVYDGFMNRNADRYTMYAVTFPGYGGSQPPPMPHIEADDAEDFTEQTWRNNAAAAILKLIEDKELDSPVLVGHFSGGQLAMRMAIEHPDGIGPVVSIAGPSAMRIGGRMVEPDRRRLMVNERMAAENPSEEFWDTMARRGAARLVTNPGRAQMLGEMMAGVSWPVARRYWLEALAADVSGDLERLESRLLVIAPLSGEPEERAGERAWWEGMFNDVDGASLVFIDDARQFVMFDQPERLDEAVAEFLTAKEPVAEHGAEDRVAGQ